MTASLESPAEPGSDAAESLKARLRADLKLAMRARAKLDVGVLRALIAALDNAQAVQIGKTHHRYVVHAFGDGCNEVPRLALDTTAVDRLLEGEVESRLRAADQFEQLGRLERAAELRAEAALAERYRSP